MTLIAELAKSAAKSEREEKALEAETKRVVFKQRAYESIAARAVSFQLEPKFDEIEDTGSTYSPRYAWNVEVTPDLTLVIEYSKADGCKAKAKASEQLYYDLDPEFNTVAAARAGGKRGGTYACFGLNNPEVETLAQLGAQVEKVERAREEWNRKRGR